MLKPVLVNDVLNYACLKLMYANILRDLRTADAIQVEVKNKI